MCLIEPNLRQDEDRWAAVVRRDAEADGVFLYAVRTTGVYCRPSCRARAPLRQNVAFFDSGQAAQAAGFRPCKRCMPEGLSRQQIQGRAVAEACRIIAQAEQPPSLQAVARAVGLSPHHLHRLFKAATGITPSAYAVACRVERVRDGLIREGSVTAAIYDAGYGSNGRFYATSDAVLGMSPSAFRAGGEGASIRFAIGQCSLGAILVAATQRGICAILIGDDPQALLRDLQDRFPRADLGGGDAGFEAWMAQVVGLVEAPTISLDLPLDIRGTAFQQRVWQALRAIPPGSTATYTQIAAALGAPKAVRAVAGACAANALAVAIPCHRVVRQDGSLSGYRWGVERKRALLDREASRR